MSQSTRAAIRLSLFAVIGSLTAGPAPGDLFSDLSPAPLAASGRAEFLVDFAALRAALIAAPAFRAEAALDGYGLRLGLPTPDGGRTDCLLADSPVMELPLQARFPDMRTYVVQSLDRTATGRLEITPRGLSAMLRTAGGTWMIDPVPGAPERVVASWLRAPADWTCHAVEGVHGFSTPPREGFGALPADPLADPPTDRGPAPATIRTLRLAMACTGEWGLHQCVLLGHAPNPADPLAAIVTTVSRVNVVYEGDLGIHFNLVANNDQVIFTDPATDPYPDACDGTGGADCSSGYLGPNASTLASRIGSTNFDIGHVLTRVYGGVANLSSVCTNNKARGVSGIPRGGDVDHLAFLVVVHEMGHQFGAGHTFSGRLGRCAGNVSLSTAWEAGSGSSPMAYPGGCPVGDVPPSDNVAIFADPYFHHGSLAQITTFLGTTPTSCPARTTSTNTPPSFTVPAAAQTFAIPPSTPFELSALATDPDGDTLSYSWEQFDSGASRTLEGPDAADTGIGALFRIFPPTPTPSRSFPRLADLLSGTPTRGEQLPSFTGVTRRFRCVVRDNHPGVGASVISPFTDLAIAAGASPFAVTSPALGASLAPGSHTITWTVGSTDAAPISCTSVTIHLSENNGASFATNLGSFPNTGSAAVMLPGGIPAARIRIDADANVFFAISPAFELLPCPADFNLTGGITVQDIFDFLDAWFSADPRADINHTGGLTVQDVFDFLTLWFTPCP